MTFRNLQFKLRHQGRVNGDREQSQKEEEEAVDQRNKGSLTFYSCYIFIYFCYWL